MAEGTGGPVPFTHPPTLPPSSLPSSLPQTQPSVGWVPVTGKTGLAQRVSAFHMARVLCGNGPRIPPGDRPQPRDLYSFYLFESPNMPTVHLSYLQCTSPGTESLRPPAKEADFIIRQASPFF